MRDHPIETGRWIALHDDAFWRPMRGVVSHATAALNVDPELAARTIRAGVSGGTIAHRPSNPTDRSVVASPRAAELARLSGISYDDHIDWGTGALVCPPGYKPMPLDVYWPDVERAVAAARGAASALPKRIQAKRGPKSSLTARAAAAMLADLRAGVLTRAELENGSVKQEVFAARYGLGRTAAVKARDLALSQFVTEISRDK